MTRPYSSDLCECVVCFGGQRSELPRDGGAGNGRLEAVRPSRWAAGVGSCCCEVDRLFAYGIELMETGESDPALCAVGRAERFRDGLIFAFLAARPLRRTNMIELVLGEDVIETHDGYRVRVAPEA